MNPNHTILLLEDEKEQADLLADYLRKYNYEVLQAYSGSQALKHINTHSDKIHLAALDIMVPDLSGKELCKKIRSHPLLNNIPVLFITAKDKERNEIEGLDLGADAYITKPAGMGLIKARIDVLLRRQNPRTARWFSYKNLFLDLVNRKVTVSEKVVDLTPTEFILMEVLFRHPKVTHTRSQLLERLSSNGHYVFDRTIDTHIKNLRKKLGKYAEIIRTHHGFGYYLNCDVLRK